MAAPKVAGTCFIKVDSSQLEVSGGVECPLNETVKETKMGSNGPAGYSEVAQLPYVKVTAFVKPDFDIDKIVNGKDITVTAELANGKVYVLSQAYVVGEPALKNDDGTVDLEFNGMKGIWQ